MVVVAAGERVPVDGTVVRGEALVNQQTLTGEALPVERGAGDPVFAATVVEHGEIEVRVERVGLDTAVGRILRAVDAPPREVRHPGSSSGWPTATSGARSCRRPRHRGLAQLRRRHGDPGGRLRPGRARRHPHRDPRLDQPGLRARHPHQGAPARSRTWPASTPSCSTRPARSPPGPRASTRIVRYGPLSEHELLRLVAAAERRSATRWRGPSRAWPASAASDSPRP